MDTDHHDTAVVDNCAVYYQVVVAVLCWRTSTVSSGRQQ